MPASTRAWWRARVLPLPLEIGQFAWECRLGHEAQTVDFQAQVRLTGPAPPDTPPAWRAAAAFLATWRGPIFLEIDQDEALDPLLFPRVDIRDREMWLLVAGSSLDMLSSGEARPYLPLLRMVVAALPAAADPLYVAWLGPRGSPHLRFLASVPRTGLRRWLEAIGWAGDAERTSAVIDRLNPWSSHVPAAIDLAEDIGCRLGVELHWPGPPRPNDRTEQCLDALLAWQELDPARIEAARRWRWGPSSLAPRLQLKVAFAAGRRSAKAYLGAWTEPPG